MSLWHQITDAQRDELVHTFVGALSQSTVPPHLRDGLVRYFADGILPGSFLQAVLCNDLTQAVRRESHGGLTALHALIDVLIEAAPSAAWGSRDAVLAWTTTPNRLEV